MRSTDREAGPDGAGARPPEPPSGRGTEDAGPPSLGAALLPLGFLVAALAASLSLYGEDSSYGPNQIALMLGGCLALLVGVRQGRTWHDLEREVYQGMGIVFAPLFILLAVGLMIATWIAGGIVPTMIYYGLKILNPAVFYAAACLVCAVVSLAIGSSWTTAASVGVALVGTAAGLGISLEITAGAVISGAYFGDKMSPLSDTTNLASAVTEAELFTHIRHMTWTALPALCGALLLFVALGLSASAAEEPAQLAAVLRELENSFLIHPLMLLPLLALFVLAWLRMPALPALLLAALMGSVFALLFQAPGLRALGGSEAGIFAMLSGLWKLSVSGFESVTGNEALDGLLSGGGSANMLNTIWLILSAVFFGSAMEKTGLLGAVLAVLLRRVKSTAHLVTAVLVSCVGTNVITGDQYIAIVLPGRMYKAEFRRRGLAPVNLSRALEDSATVTSPLVPWNTCGAFMAATLGVSTLAYMPFCFFNWLMPVISLCFAVTNFKILPLVERDLAQPLAAGN